MVEIYIILRRCGLLRPIASAWSESALIVVCACAIFVSGFVHVCLCAHWRAPFAIINFACVCHVTVFALHMNARVYVLSVRVSHNDR